MNAGSTGRTLFRGKHQPFHGYGPFAHPHRLLRSSSETGTLALAFICRCRLFLGPSRSLHLGDMLRAESALRSRLTSWLAIGLGRWFATKLRNQFIEFGQRLS